jgi:hypothetical protein
LRNQAAGSFCGRFSRIFFFHRTNEFTESHCQ